MVFVADEVLFSVLLLDELDGFELTVPPPLFDEATIADWLPSFDVSAETFSDAFPVPVSAAKELPPSETPALSDTAIDPPAFAASTFASQTFQMTLFAVAETAMKQMNAVKDVIHVFLISGVIGVFSFFTFSFFILFLL